MSKRKEEVRHRKKKKERRSEKMKRTNNERYKTIEEMTINEKRG